MKPAHVRRRELAMKRLVLVAMIASLSGCAPRGRPTLEPEGTITRSWVGDAPAAPAETPPPPPATAAGSTEVDGADAMEETPAASSPAKSPPGRRGWVKGGSWDR